MDSDISDKIEQTRRELLGPKRYEDTRRSTLERAISRYNLRAEQAIEESRKYRKKENFLKGKKAFLDNKISKAKKDLDPDNISRYQRLEDLISQRRILDHLKVEGEELTYEKLEMPKHVHNYRTLLRKIFTTTRTTVDEKGFTTRYKSLVNFVKDPKDAASTIRNSADFEIVLLDSQFELPAPFSQRYLKRPKKTKEAAKQTEILETEPLFLVPYRKTKAGFENHHLTPEMVYQHQARRLRRDRNYLGITHTGFDSRKRLQLQTNNAIGIRMFLFSEYIKEAEEKGEKVKPSDKVRISTHYAHGAEGEVLSRSGVRQRYDPVIRNMADIDPDSEDYSAHSRWVDTSGDCHCKDQKYIALLHAGRTFDPVYTCPHTAALQCQYIDEEHRQGNLVLNALVFPTAEQAFYEKKVNSQALVLKKEDGNVKSQLNRGEKEFLLMRNLVERGFNNTATTYFTRSITAMEELYLK